MEKQNVNSKKNNLLVKQNVKNNPILEVVNTEKSESINNKIGNISKKKEYSEKIQPVSRSTIGEKENYITGFSESNKNNNRNMNNPFFGS